MLINLQDFTKILHKSSFGFYINRISFEDRKQNKNGRQNHVGKLI